MFILPSILGTLKLLYRSHNFAQIISATLYGATLIFLFGISTSFHCIFYCNKERQVPQHSLWFLAHFRQFLEGWDTFFIGATVRWYTSSLRVHIFPGWRFKSFRPTDGLPPWNGLSGYLPFWALRTSKRFMKSTNGWRRYFI